jgi:hypothetical protein
MMIMEKNKGHFSIKHSPDRILNPRLVSAVKEKTKGNELTCAMAFDLANEFQVSAEEIGFTADRLEISITRCQLGLFGYIPVKKIARPAESFPPDLEEAIRSALVDDRLPCKSSFDIAKDFKTAKIRVSAVCETLGLKISSCQLGAF